MTKEQIEKEAKTMIKRIASFQPERFVFYEVFMRTPEKYLYSDRVDIAQKVKDLLKKIAN